MTRSKLLVIGALMLGLFLGTLDTTIVSTAMPRVVGKLGGSNLYPWVFSIYLLASTATVPIYGKLADLYGRKPMILSGIGLFLAGSLACGLAQSMEQLIIFRAMQGVGAGSIIPLVLTIIADISSSRDERNRLQGFIGAIWGISSVIGPSAGGLIVDYLDWPWVFLINLPLGLLAVTLITIFFKETFHRRKVRLDIPGVILLTGAIIALLLGLLEGGSGWDWFSLQSIGLFGGAAILFSLFIIIERQAIEPVIPLSLFTNRTIIICSIGGFLLGGLMYGITSYVPLFIQGVNGSSATEAGLILIPQTLSWSLISAFIAVILKRTGFQKAVRAGTVIALVGMGLLTLFNPQSPLIFMLLVMMLIGCGFGLASNVYTLSVQHAAPKTLIGVASASTQFVRMIGGTIGVAVMGALLNGQVQQHFAPVLTNLKATVPDAEISTNILLNPASRATLAPEILDQLKNGLAQSLTWVFVFMAFLQLLAFAIMLWFPHDDHEKKVEGTVSSAVGESA